MTISAMHCKTRPVLGMLGGGVLNATLPHSLYIKLQKYRIMNYEL